MKKIILLFSVAIVIFACFSLVGCNNEEKSSYEEKILGRWGCHSSGKTIMYSFEKDENGNYSASCATSYGVGEPSIYMFDEFSATKTVITFKQAGRQTKHYYSLEDGYLYIDNLEFEKIE